ncbi:MAG: ABC transporter permease [Coriobacteriia bacterium]|nr:ABC transporter permease [Coriobacteriia bacterium]
MYIIQNAWRNVLRNRGRNILLGCITLVVIIATVVALIISNTSSGIISDYQAQFGSQVTIQPDMQKLRTQIESESSSDTSNGGRIRMSIPTIPADQYMAFGQSDYLQKSVFTAQTNVNSNDLTAIDADKGGGGGVMAFGSGPAGGGQTGSTDTSSTSGSPATTTYMFKLIADQMTEFTDGSRTLAQGSMPENTNECIISTDLATANNISVGDTINLTGELTQEDTSSDTSSSSANTPPTLLTKDISYSLTVVGIYDDATDEYSAQGIQNAYTNRRNEILTNVDTVLTGYTDGWDGIQISATYYLKDPSMLEAFANELYSKGLDSVFNVTTDSATYNQIVQPVVNLKNIAFVFVIVVLVIGAAIIALLASLAVRERKYEIGVLRAMGLKRLKVGLGLWLELIIVTVICLVIGLGIGTAVASPISDYMLTSQTNATNNAAQTQNVTMTSTGPQAQGTTNGGTGTGSSGNTGTGNAGSGSTGTGNSGSGYPGGGGFPGGGGGGPISIMGGGPYSSAASNVPALTTLGASLSWLTVIEIVLVALILSTIAGIIATLQITKYEPIKILMERN